MTRTAGRMRRRVPDSAPFSVHAIDRHSQTLHPHHPDHLLILQSTSAETSVNDESMRIRTLLFLAMPAALSAQSIMGKGVSIELARQRAAIIKDVRYELHLDVT